MMAVDIKNLCDYSEKIRNVSHILTETLGTTTSYTFLEDTLRPYIKKNLKEYVLKHWNDDEMVEIVKALKTQAELEVKEGWVGAVAIPDGDDGEATKEAVISYALSQMDGDNIESLYRLIVKDGYTKGHLKGHVFPDVLPAFKKWAEEGKKIYMYSSGMEMSQQCLMSNSVDGDISELISGCFESSEFPSAKCESFRELCKKVDSPADKVAFLTHNAATACAAHKAGLVVIMLCREGNSYIGNGTRESFPVITSFEDISKQICGKRKKAPDAVESAEGKRAKLDESVSEKEAEPEKPEEKEAKASPEEKPAEEKTVVAKAEVGPEVKATATAEEEEKMEIDEDTKETKGKDEKSQETEVTGVTPAVDEAHMAVEKVSEDVNGGAEEAKETAEVAKVDEVNKDKEEEMTEASVKQVDGAEKIEEKVPESKEENSKLIETEGKKVEDDKTEEAEIEGKDTKEDNSALEVKADEGTIAEGEKVEKTPSTEEEKSKENGVSEAKMVQNGEAGDGAASGEDGLEKKEVNGNGVTRVNGEGDGVAGEEVTKAAEKDTEKIVAKKVEKDEAKVELATDTATESA